MSPTTNTNEFEQKLLELLLQKCPRIAGKIIEIKRGVFVELDKYNNFEQNVDANVIKSLAYYNYQYIPQKSNADCISILLTHIKKRNINSVEEIEYSYNAETGEVEEKVVNSTPIEEN